MVANYKRRKPSLVRNLWIYRRLIVLAILGGIILWFIWANRKPVDVSFPFGLGTIQSSAGVLILTSVVAGAATAVLIMTAWLTWRKTKPFGDRTEKEEPLNSRSNSFSNGDEMQSGPTPHKDKFAQDLPPPDYASRTPEGFSPSKW